jgi:uncharacterized RDD family membrane protein YckC
VNAPLAAFVPCPNHPEVTTGLTSCARCGRNYCGDCLVQLGGEPTCASCKWERLNDLRSGTGELDLAGPGVRFLAQFIDGFVVAVPAGILYTFGILFFASRTPGKPPNPMVSLVLVLLWFSSMVVWQVVYEALMLSARGQTLGKMVLGTEVVTPQGGRIVKGQAWLRATSRVVMNVLYLPGIIDALFVFSARRQTLHDRIAQTVVVRVKR